MFQNWKPVYKEKNEKEEGEEVDFKHNQGRKRKEVDFKHNQGRKRKFPYIWSMIITGVKKTKKLIIPRKPEKKITEKTEPWKKTD